MISVATTHAGRDRPGHALPRLLRADRRGHRVLAEQHAGRVAADVAADHRGDEGEHPRDAVVGDQQQDGEPGQQRHVQRDEDAGRRRPAGSRPGRRPAARGRRPARWQEADDQAGGPRVQASATIATAPTSSGTSGAWKPPARRARVSSTTPTSTRDDQHREERRPPDHQRGDDDRAEGQADARSRRRGCAPPGRSRRGLRSSGPRSSAAPVVAASRSRGLGRSAGAPSPLSATGRCAEAGGAGRSPRSARDRCRRPGCRSETPGRGAGEEVMSAAGPASQTSSSSALLVLHGLVDAVHVLLGEVVELLLRAAHVVLARLAVLGDAVELLLGAAADVADGDLGVLALGPRHLDQVAPALLGELREHDAQDLAVVGRVHAEVAVADGLLDGAELAGVVGLDDRHARLGHGDRRHLRHRRGRAVVVDHDLVEHRRCGPAGAHRAEVLAGDRQGLVHPLLGVEQGVVDHGSSLRRRRELLPPSSSSGG